MLPKDAIVSGTVNIWLHFSLTPESVEKLQALQYVGENPFDAIQEGLHLRLDKAFEKSLKRDQLQSCSDVNTILNHLRNGEHLKAKYIANLMGKPFKRISDYCKEMHTYGLLEKDKIGQYYLGH